MYLYFGKDGKLKTKINHDAPPRQGGDLNVTVCLDMDFWDDKERWGVDGDKYWVKTASIKLASGVLRFPITATEGQVEVFSKLYNSEIVYDLVPGASYLMYKFRFSAEEVTKIPGQIEFNFSMQNMSFSDNKHVRVGTSDELGSFIPGKGENCISRELNNLTGKISSVAYKKGNGNQAFSDLSSVSGYQVGTYQERMDKSGTVTEGFVFVQQDQNPDGYTYGEVSIWMWAKATGADTTLGWIQLPQYSPTYQIPEGGIVAFGVTDITIERTVGYARALIDKEIGIKYQDIMDEFKRVYSKIAIAGTKPDWNVGENTSPAYIYNKPNVKTVLVGDISAIRETGVYIVKNSTIAPFPDKITGDYVLFHYSDGQDNHIQLVFENQNITWFRSLPSGGKDFGPWKSREIREVLHDGGAPDSATPGIVGQFYVDSSSQYLYYCASTTDGYTWRQLVNLTYFNSEKKSITDQINALKNADEAINGQIENLETSINNLSSDITTITSGLNEKFDKTGGTISGDVTVTGIVLSNEGISTNANISADGSIEGKDLHVHNNAEINGNAIIRGSLAVQGAVTSVETQNVSIKDQLFEIAKGEKGDVGLTSPAGFYVANYDGKGNNLAIVFDKTGTAYVGDVTIGENGLISDTSHLQPFATRQTTEIQDKSILQWDKQSTSLKDSGKTIDDFIEKQENNTGYNCLYGQDINNNVKLVKMSQNKDQNTVPLRTERGTLKGAQAVENDEFVTLQQLNNSERGLFEQVDFLEDKINETIAVNPGKTYILIVGDSVTFTVRNDGVYSVDMGDGTIYSNISNVTKTHNYTRKGSAHIITVSGVGTNGDFGFSLGENQNLAFRSIHFGEGIKKITNFLVSTTVDVCVLPKTITEVLSDNFTDGNATLKYAKSVYCLSETPFTISKNVFANSLRIFVKRDSLDQYKQAWYQHLPASIIVSEVDSSDLVNEIVQTTGQSTTAVMSQKATTDEIDALKGDLTYLEWNFIKPVNRLNPTTFTNNVVINLATGEEQDNAGNSTSDFIKIKTGETYTSKHWYHYYGAALAFPIYDSNKNYIKNIKPSFVDQDNNIATFTSDINGYTRVIIGRPYIETSMFVVGTEYPSEYISYSDRTHLADDIYINKSNVEGIDKAIDEAIDGLKIGKKFDVLVEKELTVLDNYIQISGSSASGAYHAEVSGIKSGEVYHIKAQTGSAVRTYVIKNKNGVIKRYTDADSWTTNHDYDVVVTISDFEDGGTLVINTVDRNYIGLKLESKQFLIDGEKIQDDTIPTSKLKQVYNPLHQKTAIFDGDSICHGTSVGSTDPTYGYGWAGRIGINNNMTYKNFGISGGVITSASAFDVSGIHSVVDTIDTMYSQFPNADYIIFEGGTNDADRIGDARTTHPEKFGTFSMTDFSGNYDINTFTGALEMIFYKATKYWKGKHIGYIVAQKMGYGSSAQYDAVHSNRRVYFERAIEICRKWGIPYKDLWNECYLVPTNHNIYDSSKTSAENIEAGNLYTDGQHLTTYGYDYITPMIEDWMKRI